MTEPESARGRQFDISVGEIGSSIEARLAGIPVKLPALDGYELGGIHFEPEGDSDPLIAVVIASGGGIPARRYRHFASFLASSGIPVLAFDYRGVGLSRPRSLRGFHATAEDWSEFDCGGAIQWMRTRYPRAELVGIAHSISTVVIGGAPNVGELSRLIFIAAHTGYYGDYRKRHRIPMALLWHGVMPALTRIFGFFPARMLRLGEDIPAGIALQWAARRTPELRPEATDRDGLRARSMLARYGEIKVPTLSISFTDDAFATEAGTQRLLALYPSLDVRYESIGPASIGIASIGHFGFFRRESGPLLWPRVLAYLQTPAGGSKASTN